MRTSRLDTPFSTGVTDPQTGEMIFITYREIPQYINEMFWEALSWYSLVKTIEYPPYAGGWMEWPAVAVSILAAFGLEQRRLEQEQIHDHRETKT